MPELYEQLGLTRWEYDRICELQGREPTHVELAVFSLMWSEHCGYKHSKPLLKRFPTNGERVLQGPGENAGIVDIGGGLAVAMKIESHNHPSAVEPYQGAATGVGGIIRDIFTMGARPICGLDSLRFGEIRRLPARDGWARRGRRSRRPRRRRTWRPATAVASTASATCSSRWWPASAATATAWASPPWRGEVYFEDAYAGNCLVNAMTVGLVRHDQIIRSSGGRGRQPRGAHRLQDGPRRHRRGQRAGQPGVRRDARSRSGRRSRWATRSPRRSCSRPAWSCCGGDLLVALQDLGAAGITSSSSEMAAKGEVGIDLHADRVPLREADMEPWEIMISESQERMLAIVAAGAWEGVKAVLRPLGPRRHHRRRGDRHQAPARVLPRRDGRRHGRRRPGRAAHATSSRRSGRRTRSTSPSIRTTIPLPDAALDEILLDLIGSPNIASRRWVWRAVRPPGAAQHGDRSPAATRRSCASRRPGAGIAVCTDGNGRQTYLDPYRGGKAAVAEAARNVSCVGAKPIAITNCLNFGNPDNGPIA